MNGSLRAQCIAEFLGTGLFLFFGICCLSALKLTGASLGLWEICIIWGLGISLAVYLTAGISGGTLTPRSPWRCGCLPASRAEKWCLISWLRSPARLAALYWPGYFTAPCLRTLKRCIIWCAAAWKPAAGQHFQYLSSA